MRFTLVTDPDEFFARELADGGFLRPLAVVALLGVVTALSSLPVVRATVEALPPEVAAFAGLGYVFALVGGFASAFVAWVVYAAVFHLIARFVFGGEGTFGRTLRTAAWGFVPAVVAGAVSGVVTYYVFQSVTLPSDPARAQAVAAGLQSDPLVLAAGVLGVFFLLWQAFIWTFGVKHAQGLSVRDAAITVAIPVGIAVLLRVYGLA